MQIGPSGRISDKNVLGLNSIELYIFIEIQMLKKSHLSIHRFLASSVYANVIAESSRPTSSVIYATADNRRRTT